MIGVPTPTSDAEFVEFVNAAYPSLSWTAFLLTGDRETAADLVQEALIRTYLAWRRVRHGDATAYARRTLVNLNIDRWRRRTPTPTGDVERADRRNAERSVDDRDQLVRMLAALPDQQRRVLVLRYFNDLPEAEVAGLLGISVGAIKSAASRGLGSIRSTYVPATPGVDR